MHKRTLVASLFLGTALMACSQIAQESDVPNEPERAVWNEKGEGPRIHEMVVVIDGARWQDVFQGTDATLADEFGIAPEARMSAEELTPNIHALMDSGVALGEDEAPISASGPNFVSYPGYVELMSGRSAACQENNCTARPRHTLADAFRDAGASQYDVSVFSSWETVGIAATRDPASILGSSGRVAGSAPAILGSDPTFAPLLANGAKASAEPGHDTYRPDSFTSELAVAYAKEHRPHFMFLALGDSDEYGHKNDYPSYLEALRAADQTVGELQTITKEWQADGERVAFVVTADHGREKAFREHGRDYPESARSWLVASGDGIAHVLPETPNQPRQLADLAPTLESWAGLGRGTDETGSVMTELLDDTRPDPIMVASPAIDIR